LYRSKKDRLIAGVCGGIGEYLGVDPTIIRLLWVAFSILYGFGILFYIAAWLIIPEEPGEAPTEVRVRRGNEMLIFIGFLMLLAGIFFLFSLAWFIPIFKFGSAIILLFIGFLLIILAVKS